MTLSCRWLAVGLLLAALPFHVLAGETKQRRAETQVQISVLVAEVNPTAVRLLGLKTASSPEVEPAAGMNHVLSASEHHCVLQALQTLRELSLAEFLAQPQAVTLSGRPASVLIGGEQAVQVPAGLGQIGVQFEEFGTRLNLLPVVLANGTVRLEAEIEVSRLDPAHGTSIAETVIPGRHTRRTHATAEVGSGQTLAIQGGVASKKGGEPVQIVLVTPEVIPAPRPNVVAKERLPATKKCAWGHLPAPVMPCSGWESAKAPCEGIQVRVVTKDGQSELEVRSGDTCATRARATFRGLDGRQIQLAVSDRCVRIEHPKFSATAERLTVTDDHRLIMDGDVKLSYEAQDETGEVTGKRVMIGFKDGKLEVELFNKWTIEID